MRYLLAAACLTLALASPALAAETISKPAPGSAEEKAIEDVMRAPMEALFGKPIAFRVQAIAVYHDYAYVLVHPERPGGKPIDLAAWKKAVTSCEQDRGDFNIEALLKRTGGAWQFDLPASGRPDACASDTIVDEAVLKARGLPIDLILSDN